MNAALLSNYVLQLPSEGTDIAAIAIVISTTEALAVGVVAFAEVAGVIRIRYPM